ncbi:MAG: DUF1156 domain-containing protein, partial [Syntrophomonadaceae bacterium]|nr:DUF1156 domain-containing protein [Syntrophomonadaceae bacterium]
ERRKAAHTGPLSLVPDEPLPPQGTLGFRVQLYGMEQWGDLFTPRQALALTTLVRLVQYSRLKTTDELGCGFAGAAQTCLALAVDKQADLGNSLNRWEPVAECPRQLFARQALPITWDFAESNPLGESSGGFSVFIEGIFRAFRQLGNDWLIGRVECLSATNSVLSHDLVNVFFTDPPYYDAVPYADLSDFFMVWLRRTVGDLYPEWFASSLAPKEEECIVDEVKGKDKAYFETTMKQALAEARRVLAPDGVGVVVFAHKSTGGWEALLQAMVEAGWTITGSWPIDTEMGTRLRARNSAALASSIHLVCRPRENPDGSLRSDNIGDWRDVLQELPVRIHEWMPRLAAEGVVGADAIFACLGPALEIFSRYSGVEKASGEQVTLKEYLEQVWAAVAREALAMIFEGADASGFEEDSRLTAMWLWTLSTGANGNNLSKEVTSDEEESEDQGEPGGRPKPLGGYVLEYDAARKIAQGLGVHMENLPSLVEIRGDKACLLPVSERARFLFGQDKEQPSPKKKSKVKQQSLFDMLGEAEEKATDKASFKAGTTTLDRIHQCMLLFAAGRGEALKRFLVEEGVGHDQRFWRLAQALSALYPSASEEKRWVDGLLARKKGLGL